MYKTTIGATAILLAIASTPSSAATPETKVINGNDASSYGSLLLPWQAAIQQRLSDNTGCGAVVISENWVVTAAHCDVLLIGNTVIAGTSNIPQGDFSKLDDKYKFNVVKRIPHPNYDDTNINHDVALFRVDRSLYSVAQPIKIATAAEQVAADQDFANTWVAGADSRANLIASGWGDTVTKGTYPSELQVVKLGGIPDDQCNNTMTDNDSFICADTNIAGLIKDVCAGDSGGPIIWQNPSSIADTDKGLRLVGVTSNGAKCSDKNDNADNPAFQLNGQYSQLASYRSWIETTIQSEDSNPSFSLSAIATPTFSQDPFAVVDDRPKSSSSSGGSSGGSVPLWGLSLLSLIGFIRCRR
jgi:secreted trypsin-like serine protease